MNLSTQDKPFYILFVIFAIIELIERSYIQIPSLAIFTACGLYYWIFLSIRYAIQTNLSLNFNATGIIKLLLIWNIIIIIRGILDSQDYWDYKSILFNKGPYLLFPFSIFLISKINLLKKLIQFLLKYYLFLSIIIMRPIFWANTGRIISNLLPLLFFFTNKYKFYLLAFVFISLPFTWEARGWIIRAILGISLSLMVILRIKNSLKIYLMKFFYIICIFAPLSFVYLGYTGKFNVFAMDQYITVENKEDIIDTRSFLYELVDKKLSSEDKKWIGLGGISNYWDNYSENAKIASLRNKGRTSTESGILNMYLYGGWIGAALFSILFWISAFYGIFRSKNLICKLTGCFIICRWIVSFVDEPEIWLCSNLMLYLFIGLCLNKRYREIPNSQWINFFKNLGKYD